MISEAREAAPASDAINQPAPGWLPFLYGEVVFAMLYETWFGRAYLSGLAGELGVSVAMVTLITGLPWIGSTGQVLSAWWLSRAASAKQYAWRAMALGRSVWIFALLLALIPGISKVQWMAATTGIACFANVCSSSGDVAWLAWMHGVVPAKRRGMFFGVRQRYWVIGILAANLLGSLLVGWRRGGPYTGYAVLGVLAILSGWISLGLLTLVPPSPRSSAVSFERKEFLRPLRDPRFRVVLVLWPLLNGMVQIMAPFFPYFFTSEIGVPMSRVALWIMLGNVGSLVTVGYLGARIDRTGSALEVLLWMGLLLAVSPLVYVLPTKAAILWLAPPEHFANGIANGGLKVAILSLLCEVTPEERNSLYFCIYTAFIGIFGALGTFAGGFLIRFFQAMPSLQIHASGFRTFFVAGAALRALVVLGGLYWASRTFERTRGRMRESFIA
jgi:MFS family permease